MTQRRKDLLVIRIFLGRLAVFSLFLWIIFGVIFGIAPMANMDMEPKICAGDLMLYYRLESEFRSGDVVIMKKDDRRYTGRIVAKGGDIVDISNDAELKVNGSIVTENQIYYKTPVYESDVKYPVTLNSDEYFVLGDFREAAKDSRFWGPVSQNEICGKVITVIRRSGI